MQDPDKNDTITVPGKKSPVQPSAKDIFASIKAKINPKNPVKDDSLPPLVSNNDDDIESPPSPSDSEKSNITKEEVEEEVDAEVEVEVEVESKQETVSEQEQNLIYGLTYDEYKANHKSLKSLASSMKQCGYCLKFFESTKNGFITKSQSEEGELICYHCLYWVNYSQDLRATVDGVYEKTIHDYILECAPYHVQDECIHKGECFVCDYLNGIRIIGIFGEDELFSQGQVKVQDEDIDNIRFTITI